MTAHSNLRAYRGIPVQDTTHAILEPEAWVLCILIKRSTTEPHLALIFNLKQLNFKMFEKGGVGKETGQ